MLLSPPAPPARRWLVLLVWLAFLLEVVLFTFGRNVIGPYWSPVALLLCGLTLAGAAAVYTTNCHLTWAPAGQPSRLVRWVVGSGAVLLSAVLTGGVVAKQIGRQPLSELLTHSDIVPALQVYVSRWLSGAQVYQRIELGGYSFLPNYPPLQWLPFVPAELLGIDYRWWAAGALLLALAAYQILVARLGLSWGEWLLKALVPVLVVHFVVLTERNLMGLTVESLAFGYYALLALAILHRSAAARAIALVFCVLSRYSLALWLPLYAVLLWYESPKQARRTIGLALALTGAILVAFLWHDPSIFLRAQLENFDVTVGEWQNHVEDTLHGWPRHVFTGTGLAPWWYHGPAAAAESIRSLQTVHFAVCAAVPLLWGLWWWPRRHRLDVRLVALFSLKAYLAVFYAFLILPYVYLAILSLVWSWFVVAVVSGSPQRFLQPIALPAAPNAGSATPTA
ncbi:hypothetical protein F0P96_13925 [Hymenobacter busanensis]|uniref:Uncharacterized protein n=1 Tax=Hymenobacter busanensis TaxID=2607656 RepID=A0A7L4ZYE3_9BACT|nr:hypothetical protein [Hymenobacter busanensis]KAA9331341.1 hypothetical protein F0P96_13925 [Hymenobacter busanensis]QHJ08494.1 hypothetical protein GUY19_14850 [Hymenobacter busanensis]